MKYNTFHFALLAALLLTACTDGRKKFLPEPLIDDGSTYRTVKTVLFGSNEIHASAMDMDHSSGALFLTGKPFGFSRWNVMNPVQPETTYSASDNLAQFTPGTFGPWVFDYYASGSLAIRGISAVMSGAMGSSLVDTSNPYAAREINRFPHFSDAQPRDDRFVYRALVAHPTLNRFYGFRDQDSENLNSIYTLEKSGTNLNIVSGNNYGGGGCCATGATFYGSSVVLAIRKEAWIFPVNSNGGLQQARVWTELRGVHNIVSVKSTPNLIYVQSSGGTKPPGIYIFDFNARQVGYVNVSPMVWAPITGDQYIYAEMGVPVLVDPATNRMARAISIFEILWDKMQ